MLSRTFYNCLCRRLPSFPIVNLPVSCNAKIYYCTTKVDPAAKHEEKKISTAMQAYLERARSHDAFIEERKIEYQIGKRHLANMMGEDPEHFTQQDVDDAIAYLFPSGLFEKKARPLMKPPEIIYPKRKAAEFDETGRPYHFLFYTGKPNFYQLLYDAVEKMEELRAFEDTMIAKGQQEDATLKLSLTGYQWYDKMALEVTLMETLADVEYDAFVSTMERLCALPYSYRVKDFIFQYNVQIVQQTHGSDILTPNFDEKGVAYVTVYDCCRKAARGHVTVRMPGTGLISINNEDITYFKDMQSREQILFPLIFSNMLNKVDVEATVTGGGYSGQSGAIRWGIAWALRSFVDEEMVEKMRLAGLITKDFRTRERKKPGQWGARRKFTWKKR